MSFRSHVRFGLVACIAGASALPSLAAAQDRARPGPVWNARDDAHGPDHRTDGERRPSPDRMFARIDVNHDGSISRSEFMTFHTQRMAMREGHGVRPGVAWGHGGNAGRRPFPMEARPH